ncbi:LptF/LptG family permease [Flavobacteriaceae bacterium TK19130]|nr:LptF/LptG family permease [Thermobacterium salinum]
MKILDRYILISYLKTFISVFIILMFIFVLQTIWLYISELAGKDLDIWIVLKFLWYVSPRLMPLVLPLTILVTSLMVFGNFAEKYEFAAMKSTGISLQRAMRGLMVFIGILSITAFFFANNVIPYSEYKWQNLRRNIAQLKPSMAITEGQFSQVGDAFNIKVEEKSGDRDQYLKNVVIHKKNPDRPNGNYTVIIAEDGELVGEENSNTLSLILNNGNYYEDVQVNDLKQQRRRPFAKSEFVKSTINIDLTEFNSADFDKDNNYNNQNMYNVEELNFEIDSLSRSYTNDIEAFSKNMYFRSGINKYNYTESADDTLTVDMDTVPSIVELFDESIKKQRLIDLALNNANGTLQSIAAKQNEFKNKTKRLNKFEIALHEKFALAAACIILFFVGAPLGAIIRKGGMGLPMVVAVLLFLTYHFIGIFAKNSAEDGTMHPFIATWLSTAIMLPLSIWLTYRATTDQGIIDIDAFFQRIAKLFGKKEEDAAEAVIEKAPLILTQHEKSILKGRNISQLKDIFKNYRQYGYSEELRAAVLMKLKEMNVSEMELKATGDFENRNYTEAKSFYDGFCKNSKNALLAYAFVLLGVVGSTYFDYANISMAETGLIAGQAIFIIATLIFYYFAIKSVINYTSFQKLVAKKDEIGIWLLVFIAGLLVYVILHFSLKNKMKEELETIR